MRSKIFISFLAILLLNPFVIVSHSLGSVPERTETISSIGTISARRLPFIENIGQLNDNNIAFYVKTFAGTFYVTTGGKLVYILPDTNGEICMLTENLQGVSVSNVIGQDKVATKVSHFKGKDSARRTKNIPTYNIVHLGEIYAGIELELKAYGNNVEKLFHVKPGADADKIRISMGGGSFLRVNAEGKLEVETKLGVVSFTRPLAYQEGNGHRNYIEVSYVVNGSEYAFQVGSYDRSKELVIDPLLASTYLGGSYDDYITCMALDDSGSLYVAGVTDSIDFPVTMDSYNPTFTSGSFVAKFDSNFQNLLASTFLEEGDMVHAISVDGSGNVYIAGATGQGDLRDFRYWDLGFFTGTYGNGNRSTAFVTKLDSDLQNVLASITLQGSGGKEMATSLSLDSNGNVFVLGMTNSFDFSVTDGVYNQTYYSGWDVFIAKFDENLGNLLASTFVGGGICSDDVPACSDYPLSLYMDHADNVFVAGATASTDFPFSVDAYDTSHNGSLDGFVLKLDNNLENLLASTFLGGSYDDFAYSLSGDNSGNIYVTGMTRSLDFPTSESAYDTSYNGNGDVFVSKFDNQLTTLQASTFIGGSGGDPGNGWFPDVGYAIHVDNNGGVFVAGCTHSVNGVSDKFPTTENAYSPAPYNGHTNAFVSKIDSDLQNMVASTFFGGDSGHDYIYSVILDYEGSVVVSGKTSSSELPVSSDSYDTTNNLGGEAFVAKFDNDVSGDSVSVVAPSSSESGDSGGCFIHSLKNRPNSRI